MTPQESQMLNDLARKITQTQLQEKDPEAEQLLQQSLGHDQDALYKLAQTVLVQNIALDQARQQILQLQQQPPPSRATSFLGSLLGHKDPAPAPPSPSQSQGQYQQVPPQYAQPAYDAQPVYGQPAYGQPTYAQQPAGSGGSSFLRSAATTAAGVAAGALAFEGVESLLHMGHGGFGGGGFGGDYAGGFGGGGFDGAPREEVINNYYGSPEGGYDSGPNEQPQGGYDVSGQDEQPQGADPSFDDPSVDPGSDDGGDFGGDEDNFA
jgi:hypothetical protein